MKEANQSLVLDAGVGRAAISPIISTDDSTVILTQANIAIQADAHWYISQTTRAEKHSGVCHWF